MDNLRRILELPSFLIEKETLVDGKKVYIRPIYIELIYLYPDILNDLVDEIAEELQKFRPSVLFAIEASVLPLAALIAEKIKIPLSIIRKPRNFRHEIDEPDMFLSNVKEYDTKLLENPILIDDAIWSGFTIDYVLDLFEKMNIPFPKLFFLFDFYEFNSGGNKLKEKYKQIVKNRICWHSYQDILNLALHMDINNKKAYQESMKLMNHQS
ncbi:MAG: phosphoribosyltransferase family protein [Thermacetogeniaceae bacterium]